jgi:uncharacterized protein (DUF924 family)
MHAQAQEIVEFWFSAAVKARWFKPTPEFDAQLRDKYSALLRAARAGELHDWADTAQGALALILLLDQLPRNIYRGDAESFAGDAQALSVARQALVSGFDTDVDVEQRQFFYLPFMHSEELADQEQCVALCEATRAEENIKFARLHRDLIARFGRFPHRNRVLNRESTDAELDYLASDGAFRG